MEKGSSEPRRNSYSDSRMEKASVFVRFTAFPHSRKPAYFTPSYPKPRGGEATAGPKALNLCVSSRALPLFSPRPATLLNTGVRYTKTRLPQPPRAHQL